MTKYSDAVNDALERLDDLGYERGPEPEGFVAHGTMCAEALATLGYPERIPGYIDGYRSGLAHHDRPEPRFALDPDDWREALGDFPRVGDWEVLFARELAEAPWQEVLVRWWPRLLPGVVAGTTHGLIRTAHAVRSLAATPRPTRAQLTELTRGLAFWAARWTRLPGRVRFEGDKTLAQAMAALPRDELRHSRFRGGRGRTDDTSALDTYAGYHEALRALRPQHAQWLISEMTAEFAGVYLAHPEALPVPPIHGITAPAAARLVLPHLPEALHGPTVAAVWQVQALFLIDLTNDRNGEDTALADADAARTPGLAELAARAVEHGDDHVIKVAEACLREHALRPDPRYAAAAYAAQERIPPYESTLGRAMYLEIEQRGARYLELSRDKYGRSTPYDRFLAEKP
ncbi:MULTISPECIES: hypothetical protein [unclassified Streptomyces]|uniref:hypothetical protein n=1 Tax=unclassified Streptomyces TaxID=2593676 RepID=UPI00278BE04A|nr:MULTISPECIES: hypothetical protein [unclassified Streptomyces]